MRNNRKEWLKLASALALGLLLAATAMNVSAQRKVKLGRMKTLEVGGTSQGAQTFRQTLANNTGYDEGVKAGRSDRRRNERLNFKDESVYQNATKGYTSRLGDKTLYQKYFRKAFENGYRDGWNGY